MIFLLYNSTPFRRFRELSERDKWRLVIILLLFFAFMGMIIRKNTETTTSYDYLLGVSTPTPDVSLQANSQATETPQQTLTPAQESYNQGMQALRDLVDGGKLQVEGQQAVQHFRRATQLDPTMAEAYRNYGLLMFEFWKLSPYDSTWRKANDALLKFRDLTEQPDPDVDAALEQLANPRGM